MRKPRKLGLVVIAAGLALAVVVQFWPGARPGAEDGAAAADGPSLVALQARHEKDLLVLGLAFDDAPQDQIAAFAKEHRATFPIIRAAGPDAELFGGVIGLPTTFVVNRTGRVPYSHTGYASAAMFEAAVQAALRDGGL